MSSPIPLRILFFALCMPLLGHLAEAADQRSLLVFGDSLSTGYGMELERSWPALLQQRLQEAGHAVRVVNASRKGETSDGGLKRLQPALDKYRPSWVLLELGANDGLTMRPISALKANLLRMVQMVRASGATPILVSMALPPYFDPAYARDFGATFSDAARETNTALVPFLLKNIVQHPDMFGADHLHPTAEAQPKLLDVVWPVVDPLLSVVAEPSL